MFHLNDRTLERLVTGSASVIEVDRIRRHVAECRACARRLEEWRDTFGEVDRHFPTLAVDEGPGATVTPGGLVLVPTSEAPRPGVFDLANILWGLAVVLAIVVGYGLSQLGGPKVPGGQAQFSERAIRPLPPPPPPALSSVIPPGARDTTIYPALPNAARDSEPVVAPRPEPETPALPVSPRFSRIARPEAARRLGGPVRGIAGMAAAHYEVGPASAVAGAQRDLDVVRVVYRAGNRRITLDQQLIPVDSTGFRPIDDPALESGETVFRTGPGGMNTAIWLDEAGYRLALSAPVSPEELRRMVQRVQ